MHYINAFADYYRESKSLVKTKDDPSYCPPSFCITIPLQPMLRVKESIAFKALADESARVAAEISRQMAAQILKCKCLNNADKQHETVELYAKGLANMAEIFLAESHANNTNKHDLVIDLLTQHQQDALSHLPVNLSTFIVPTIFNLHLNSHLQHPHTHPPAKKIVTQPT